MKTLFALIATISYIPILAQEIIADFHFDEANGSTSGSYWTVGQVNDCDDIPYVFSVQNGKFHISEAEGASCCGCVPEAPSDLCGNNDNSIIFGPFDVSGYYEISFDISISAVGALDCPTVPLSTPLCVEGTGADQIILSYSIDGGSENFIPLFCGANEVLDLNTFHIPLSDNQQFNFSIYGGTQTEDESYFINSVKLVGLKHSCILDIIGPKTQVCEGDNILLESVVSNCNNCDYLWFDDNGIPLSNQTSVTINSIQNDENNIRSYALTIESSDGCSVTKIIEIILDDCPMTNKTTLQIDESNIFINGPDYGVIFISSNGKCWRISIDDSGNFKIIEIICP